MDAARGREGCAIGRKRYGILADPQVGRIARTLDAMNLSKFTRIGALTLAVLHTVVFISGCEVVTEFTNEPPKITYFTVPAEVAYGETVEFKVGAYDAENDPLTYSWEVSAGRLTNPAEPEVQWTAPELPPGEAAPAKVVSVDVSVQDRGEEDASETGSIIVFSKTYRIMETFMGTYTLISKRVQGARVEETGVLRLTPTTFTREFRASVDGDVQIIVGSYKLVVPFGMKHGRMQWLTQGDPAPSVATYSREDQRLSIFFPATSTEYVYTREGTDPGAVDSEPINTDKAPVEITDETFANTVLDAELPVVVEFRADWSPFCKQMTPIVAAVAVGSGDTFIVGRLDIDKNPETLQAYKIDGIPTYLVFRDGKEVARFAGAMPKPIFVQKILDALK